MQAGKDRPGDGPSGSVLLSGASGMLGQALRAGLAADGWSVTRLVRRAAAAGDEVRWNPTSDGAIDAPERLEGLAAALHLSGANISTHRWTGAWKQAMWASRVESTRVLSERLAGLRNRPEVLVCASAIGWYGDRGDAWLDEEATAGSGYFPELCAAWEAAARPAAEAGIRVVHLRLGIVLGRRGGALERMLPLFRAGLGGRLGDGRQWMSWIGEADAVRAFLFGMRCQALRGAVNGVAPEPVINREFTRALAQAVRRPALLPAPAWALRLAFGEMADAALLASARVVPRRLLEAGFRFQHAQLADALSIATASHVPVLG
jgi:hypothetical protein